MATNAHELADYSNPDIHNHLQPDSESLLAYESNTSTTELSQRQSAAKSGQSEDHFTKPDSSGRKGATHRTVKSPGFLSVVCKKWLTELCACLVAMLALMAIIITLATHNGRPLPNWPFSISVNALVSIFAIILKGTVMVAAAEAVSQLKWSWYREPRPLEDLVTFDNASRGVWGSTMLIRRLRGMHLASIGAGITVLAVASDPFIQQVIKYHPCAQVVGNGTALIARTNNYTRSGIHTGAGLESLDLPMQAAIYEGVYDSFSHVEPTCTTGNCTFFDYKTVGMCSRCHDISSTINTTCNATTYVEGGYSCIWQLSSGLNLSIPNPTRMIIAPSPYPTDSSSATTDLSTTQVLALTSVLAYNQNHTFEDMSGTVNAMALECSLNPCVRSYAANVTGGKLSEVLLSTEIMKKTAPSLYSGYSASPMPCLINGTYYNSSSFTERNSTNWIQVYGLLPNNQTAYLPMECYFSYPSTLGLEEYLPDFLAGYAEYAPEDELAEPEWMGQLFNGENATLGTVNATWTAIAESMTVRIRQAGDEVNSAPASGSSWHNNTCISVQWPWLAFPAILIILTIAFLLATIVQSTQRSRQQIWKASPLALLFHGLDHELREKFSLVNETDEMEETAKELFVKVGHKDGGLRLIEACKERA